MATMRERITRQLRAIGCLGASPEELAADLRAPDRTDRLRALKAAVRASERTPQDAEPDPRFAIVEEALERDRDAELASAAMRALAHWGGARALPALAAHLARAEAPVVAAALEALGAVPLAGVAAHVVPFAAHADARVRSTALAVLRRCDRAAALDAAGALITAGRTHEERMAAVKALAARDDLPGETLRELAARTADPVAAAELEELRARTMPAGLSRSAILLRSRISRSTLVPPVAGAATPVRTALCALVAAVALGLAAGAASWTAASPDGAVHAAGALAALTPAAAARAPLAEVRGARASWRGTVAELRGADVLVVLPGGTARVSRRGADVRAGDLVDVSGRVRARSAMGLVYLDGEVTRVSRGGRAP